MTTLSSTPRWQPLLPWLVLLVLAAVPWAAQALGLDYYVAFARRVLVLALAAASLNLILGFGGLAALGHVGFVGVGAYTLVALMDAGLESAWLLWLAAMVVSAAVAAAIGALALRTRGVYFIMITLAFAQMLYFAAVSLRAYGGDDGYNLPQRPVLGLDLDANHGPTLYWVVLAVCALAMALLNRVSASALGQALAGARDNEARMQALGFPVFRLRLAAFVLAGSLAGLAGALLVTNNSFISPSAMHWTQSATLIVMVVIGGAGHRWGGPVGAACWIVLEELVRRHTEHWHLPLGLLVLLIVFVAPRGLAGLVWPARWRPTGTASSGPVEGAP